MSDKLEAVIAALRERAKDWRHSLAINEPWMVLKRSEYETLAALRAPTPEQAGEVGRTMAAGRIIDVMTGGKFDWRSRLDESDFLESADWLTALSYADAALSDATAHVSDAQEAIRAIEECLSFGMPDRGQIKKHLQVIATRLQSQTVGAGDGEICVRCDKPFSDHIPAAGWAFCVQGTYAFKPPSPHPIARVSEDTASAVERAVAKAVYYSGCGLTCPYRDIISGRCERHGPTEADLIVERVTAGFRRDLKSIMRSEK